MSNQIAFINGSPRTDKTSFSKHMIQYISRELGLSSNAILEVNALKLSKKPNTADLANLLSCTTMVIVSPLYVDALPSPLLQLLRNLEVYKNSHPVNSAEPIALYGVINCGFLGGSQNHIALDILGNFAKLMGFKWMGGLGVGSGEMFKATMESIPKQSSIQSPIYKGLEQFISCLRETSPLPVPNRQLYVSQNFSQKGFIFMANMGWLPQSGWKFRKIYARPYLKLKKK